MAWSQTSFKRQLEYNVIGFCKTEKQILSELEISLFRLNLLCFLFILKWGTEFCSQSQRIPFLLRLISRKQYVDGKIRSENVYINTINAAKVLTLQQYKYLQGDLKFKNTFINISFDTQIKYVRCMKQVNSSFNR